MFAAIQDVDVSKYERIIAISDIHGAATLFDRLLEAVGFCQDDALILVGDYIERGDASLPLLRRMMALSQQGNVFALKGNCDNLIDDLFEPRFRGDMLRYLTRHPHTVLHEMLCEQGTPFGEQTTVDALKSMVATHYQSEWDWLNALPHIIRTGEHVFVHAGLDQGPLSQQDDDRCLKRQDFFETAPAFPFPLVVGHMPCQRLSQTGGSGPVFDPERNLAFIDGGVNVVAPATLNALIIRGADYQTVCLPQPK